MKALPPRELSRLYRRRIPPDEIIHLDLARELGSLSAQLGRQLGLLIDRRGSIRQVIVGDHRRIVIPHLREFNTASGRLSGLRLVHTHLKQEPLSAEDLSDLVLLRLDCLALLQLDADGGLTEFVWAQLKPRGGVYQQSQPWTRSLPKFSELIAALEEELAPTTASPAARQAGQECAYIVHVASRKDAFADEVIAEMQLLARSSQIKVARVVRQFRNRLDPATVMGRGRLTELCVDALGQGVTMLLFSSDLHPTQVSRLAELTDLKIVDRTQLILDIFARRATSSDGKLQVELAQLNYLYPRLAQQDTSMSRLMGGIGGRGPGETKLEMDRRRVRSRITRLKRDLKKLAQLRSKKRQRRRRQGSPLVALVGYTNVGKSTLFNQLCASTVKVENAAFATLDPVSRQWHLPDQTTVVLMDTVGFIRDLPHDLTTAFQATLEEIGDASLIIHVMDASHADLFFQMESVEKLLQQMGFADIVQLRLLNKLDQIDPLEAKLLCKRLGAVAVSAMQPASLKPLLDYMVQFSQQQAWGHHKADQQSNK